MKRLISLILCMALLSSLLTGCNNPSPLSRYDELERILETAPEGEYENAQYDIYDGGCMAFESSIEVLTDIVKATYVTTKKINKKYIHIFEVLENIRGIEEDKLIYVHANVYNLDGHSNHIIKYKKGDNYLLLLHRLILPYVSYDYLSSINDSLCIPLTTHGAPDLDNATICTSYLISFIKDEKLRSAAKNGNFIDELLTEIENNPFRYNSLNVIESDNIYDILKGSECVVRLNVVMQLNSENYYCDKYYCRITEYLKGTGQIEENLIEVRFPLNKVTTGKEYIVAGNGLLNFSISSKNGIYSLSELENIKAILNEIE